MLHARQEALAVVRVVLLNKIAAEEVVSSQGTATTLNRLPILILHHKFPNVL